MLTALTVGATTPGRPATSSLTSEASSAALATLGKVGIAAIKRVAMKVTVKRRTDIFMGNPTLL